METPRKETDKNKQTYAFHRFADYNIFAGKGKKAPKAGGRSKSLPKK